MHSRNKITLKNNVSYLFEFSECYDTINNRYSRSITIHENNTVEGGLIDSLLSRKNDRVTR